MNQANLNNILLLNAFVTIGQVAAVVFKNNVEWTTFSHQYLFAIGGVGFAFYLKDGKDGLASWTQDLFEKIKSGEFLSPKKAVAWVKEMGRVKFTGQRAPICSNLFATAM